MPLKKRGVDVVHLDYNDPDSVTAARSAWTCSISPETSATAKHSTGSVVISPATAKTHVSRTMIKLGARDRAQLVVYAYEAGLIRPGWLN